MRSDRERLLDILDAVANIDRHVSGRSKDDLAADELLQVWVVHHLQIIGEAASKLGRDFHQTHPVLEWASIVAMRNILVHEYFGIDLIGPGHAVDIQCT